MNRTSHSPDTTVASNTAVRSRRTRRSRRWAAAAALGVALAALLSPAAEAHDEPLIQPGAAVDLANRPTAQFGHCTLGFVFRDRRNTYIGTSAQCSGNQHDDRSVTSGVGNRAVMDNREFGTVVYWLQSGEGVNPAANPPWHEDFALIKVDPSEVDRVSPVVLDVGQAPHGVTTSAQATDRSPVFVTGSGFGLAQKPTRHRIGALVAHDETGFQLAFAGSPGDGGAPVLYGDGNSFNAYGVLSAGDHSSGMTIERVLVRLNEAGFKVELVTGIDPSVAIG